MRKIKKSKTFPMPEPQHTINWLKTEFDKYNYNNGISRDQQIQNAQRAYNKHAPTKRWSKVSLVDFTDIWDYYSHIQFTQYFVNILSYVKEKREQQKEQLRKEKEEGEADKKMKIDHFL